MKADCMYCTENETLQGKMEFICNLGSSKVYLARNQRYPGRCILSCNQHYDELFEMPLKERELFMNDVSFVAKKLKELFSADKINYGIYGDEVPHVHVHLAVKKRGGDNWGDAFALIGGEKTLPDDEFASMLEMIGNALSCA